MDRRHNKRLSKGALNQILKRKPTAALHPPTITPIELPRIPTQNVPAICLALQEISQQKTQNKEATQNDSHATTPDDWEHVTIKVESDYDPGMVFASMLPELPPLDNGDSPHINLEQWILNNNIDEMEAQRLYAIIKDDDDDDVHRLDIKMEQNNSAEIQMIRRQMWMLSQKVDRCLETVNRTAKMSVIDEFPSPFPVQSIDDLNHVELRLKTDGDYSRKIVSPRE